MLGCFGVCVCFVFWVMCLFVLFLGYIYVFGLFCFWHCYLSILSLVLSYMCLVEALCDDYSSVICYLSIC